MAWTIEYTSTARERLHKLDRQVARRIPRSVGKPLSGRLDTFWRYRVGDWRIITRIEDDILRILVVRIGHRKEVCR